MQYVPNSREKAALMLDNTLGKQFTGISSFHSQSKNIQLGNAETLDWYPL